MSIPDAVHMCRYIYVPFMMTEMSDASFRSTLPWERNDVDGMIGRTWAGNDKTFTPEKWVWNGKQILYKHFKSPLFPSF